MQRIVRELFNLRMMKIALVFLVAAFAVPGDGSLFENIVTKFLITNSPFSAASASDKWQRFSNTGCIGDPLHKHCCDVTVDTADKNAMEWLSANEYKYTSWKDGLCDSSVYPVIEIDTHPPASDHVELRKLGHGAAVEVSSLEMPASTVDCRSDKSSTPIEIKFANKAGAVAKVRGCQNQYACKPYLDCVLSMAVRAP